MIDIIILAAGRGSRLAGVMPPYMKPLMTANGESILVKLIRGATAAVFNVTTLDSRVTVVTAPENTMPIAHLLNDADIDARIVVQRKPTGPATAVKLAMQPDSARTVVLMGDNVMDTNAIQRVMVKEGTRTTVVGGSNARLVSPSFTRYRHGQQQWVEKTPITDEDTYAFVWLGPLSFNTERLANVLNSELVMNEAGEYPLGPLLNHFNDDLLTVEVTCTDIGVLE